MLDVRKDFPLLDRSIEGQRIIYLDSAATSLRPRPVIEAVTRFYTHHTANVHRAVHKLSEEATDQFETARLSLARLINAGEHELVFTRGATDAINLVRFGLPGIRRVITTTMEHHSNFLPWSTGDVKVTVIPVNTAGQIDAAAFSAALQRGADLVTISHVSNVLGTITPVKQIIDQAHAAGARVLLDGAQSVPHLPVDVKSLDVDFLVFSAHKMLGPGGVGALYGKSEWLQQMYPCQFGGSMVDQVHVDGFVTQQPPFKFEAGTPAIEAVIGWGAAADYLSALGMTSIAEHDHMLVTYALAVLGDIPQIRLIGTSKAQDRCASVAFHVQGLEAHGVARMLSNRANIMVRSGFHCAQPLHESLKMLPTIRASFYLYNTTQDIDELASALKAIVQFVRV